MADDPRLSRFLASWERDQEQGITLRAVHNRLTGHIQRYDADQVQTRDRMQRVETKLEAVERRDQNEDLADALAEGTGRHRVQNFTPQAFTPAFGTQVPADLNGSRPLPPAPPPPRESGFFRSTWRKLKKYLSHALAGLIAALFTLGISWVGAHGCSTAAQVQAAETKNDPKLPLPFEPTTQPAVPRAMPDAGR